MTVRPNPRDWRLSRRALLIAAAAAAALALLMPAAPVHVGAMPGTVAGYHADA